MKLLGKKIRTLTDEQILTDALSLGGSEEEVRAVLGLPPRPSEASPQMPTAAAKTYRLYRGETACDTRDFGPPRGEHLTLALAMVAAGLPVSAWGSLPHCPDEIFTTENDGSEVDWQIIAPDVASEFTVLAAACPHLSTWVRQ
jgi:hypothetical protein